jgi:hypothetical protein
MLDIAGVVGGFAAIAPLVLVIGAGAVPVAPSVLGFAIGGILAVAASAGLFISDCTPLGQFMP